MSNTTPNTAKYIIPQNANAANAGKNNINNINGSSLNVKYSAKLSKSSLLLFLYSCIGIYIILAKVSIEIESGSIFVGNKGIFNALFISKNSFRVTDINSPFQISDPTASRTIA